MNDFTKEKLTHEFAKRDLLIILYALERVIEPPCAMSDLYLLRNKVESMVNNYCDHESDNYTYYKSGDRCTDFLVYASHDSACFLKCKKCGVLYR